MKAEMLAEALYLVATAPDDNRLSMAIDISNEIIGMLTRAEVAEGMALAIKMLSEMTVE